MVLARISKLSLRCLVKTFRNGAFESSRFLRLARTRRYLWIRDGEVCA